MSWWRDNSALFVDLGATQYPLKLHPPLRLQLQLLDKRAYRVPRGDDPRQAPDAGIGVLGLNFTRGRAIDEGEKIARVADDKVKPLLHRHTLLCTRLLRAAHPPPESLHELVLPSNNSEPQRDLTPPAIGLARELLRCLFQYVAQAGRLALLERKCVLRRRGLYMQRSRRCCVARFE